MATASVTRECSECGKKFTVRKTFAKRTNADNWRSWMEGQSHVLCAECNKKHWQNEKTQKAMDEAKALGLPDLTGSERQVAWAVSIRADTISRLRNDGIVGGAPLNDLVASVAPYTESRWWIDNNRNTAFRTIRNDLMLALWMKLTDSERAKALEQAKQTVAEHRDTEEARSVIQCERMRLTKEAEKIADATLPPLEKPESLVSRMGKPNGVWNGKFYGKDRLLIYLDNVATKVPEALKAAWELDWTRHARRTQERQQFILASVQI